MKKSRRVFLFTVILALTVGTLILLGFMAGKEYTADIIAGGIVLIMVIIVLFIRIKNKKSTSCSGDCGKCSGCK